MMRQAKGWQDWRVVVDFRLDIPIVQRDTPAQGTPALHPGWKSQGPDKVPPLACPYHLPEV
jgi:hypothetical protein